MSTTTERVITYLLVEDNDEHADIIAQCFKHEKLASDLHLVKTGVDCLAYLGGEPPYEDREKYPYPDVVLLDLRMPGVLDGLQTLKAIRADSRHASLSVMILTSSDRSQEINHAYQLGANGYIVKSEDTQTMMDKLAQLHHSFENVVRLPDHRTPQTPAAQATEELLAAGADDSLLDCAQPTAYQLLVSTYDQDRDKALQMLKAAEQRNITRYANLATRFCTEERRRFAEGTNVDWAFIRDVVMAGLPRCVNLRKMAGIVNGITASLEGNRAAQQNTAVWQLWEGFSEAYMNQNTFTPTEEPGDATPTTVIELSDPWKPIAIGALCVLAIVLVAVGIGLIL
jgi:two-component system response regulator